MTKLVDANRRLWFPTGRNQVGEIYFPYSSCWDKLRKQHIPFRPVCPSMFAAIKSALDIAHGNENLFSS